MIQISQVQVHNSHALSFIERIYTDSFPDDERRAFAEVVKLLGENDHFSIFLLSHNEKSVGFITRWEWDHFTYIEHFAIDNRYRGAGYGAAAMGELLKHTDKPTILEVEKPLDEISSRRIRFYERLGFVLCKQPYTQPPYSPDKHSLELYLMSFGKIDLDQQFATVVNQIHREVYGVIDKNE